MLYLRTGGNGSGKSLFTLKDVRDLQLSSGRPVCFNIRPENDPDKPNKSYSNLKPETIEEFGWKPIHFKDWQAQADGTIFLIDECHYDLPTRPSSQRPPDHIAKLTEHRSRGFDFFLVTQHPKNIDSFVRNLVQPPGWHQHVKRLAGAAPIANFVQWDAVELQCEKFNSGKNAQIKTRPFPKEVYGWYDSAYLHTGKVRIPKQVFVLAVCVIAIPILLYQGFSKAVDGTFSSKTKAKPQGGSSSSSGAGGAGPKTTGDYVSAYQPRIAGLMHTAPIYDGLTAPKRVPVPAACVEMKSTGCKCYTQDATPYPVDLAMCRQLVAHGTFLAFKPEGEAAMQSPAPGPAPQHAAAAEPSQGPSLVVIAGPGERDPQGAKAATR